MDPAAAALIALAILCATGVVVYVVASGNRRAELRNARVDLRNARDDHRDDTMEGLVESMVEMSRGGNEGLLTVIDNLLAALTEPLNTPTPPPVDVHEQEVAGQAQDAIREFHDGFGGDITDTPDWTDGWMPDRRGDEPRVASVRPGDTIIPGQGNWEQMMGEGRAIVGDEVVSGEEQWEGEGYDGGR